MAASKYLDTVKNLAVKTGASVQTKLDKIPWRAFVSPVEKGPLVSQVGGPLKVEYGDIKTASTSDYIALVAGYSATPTQPLSLSVYLEELAKCGFAPIVINTCPDPAPLVFAQPLPKQAVVLRRPNIGYDFGSWAATLGVYPQIRRAKLVLLTNDSLIGPFGSLQPILDRAKNSGADITSLTESNQIIPHLQSFFLSFHGGILDDLVWRVFFNNIRVEPTKEDIVINYELGVTRHAHEHCYSTEAMYTNRDLGLITGNPTLDGWKQLLDSGVPFLKRTLFSHPDWLSEGENAAAYVQKCYGIDVKGW